MGLLRRNARLDPTSPSELCLDDGKVYRGTELCLGDTNLRGAKGFGSADAGKLVVAWARERPLFDALEPIGACGDDYGRGATMIQMRSDWVAFEGGFRSTRAKIEALEFLDARVAAVVSTVAVTGRTPELVTTTVTNPFEVKLERLEVIAHYECGPGKPMPRFVPRTLTVEPGASVAVSIPAVVDADGAPVPPDQSRNFRLASVDLRLVQPGLRIDASTPIARR